MRRDTYHGDNLIQEKLGKILNASEIIDVYFRKVRHSKTTHSLQIWKNIDSRNTLGIMTDQIGAVFRMSGCICFQPLFFLVIPYAIRRMVAIIVRQNLYAVHLPEKLQQKFLVFTEVFQNVALAAGGKIRNR